MNERRFQNHILTALADINNAILDLRRTINMDLTDVDKALTVVDTDVATLKASNAAILAKLQAGPQTPDTAAQVAHIQAVDLVLQQLLTADASALTPTPPVAPTP